MNSRLPLASRARWSRRPASPFSGMVCTRVRVAGSAATARSARTRTDSSATSHRVPRPDDIASIMEVSFTLMLLGCAHGAAAGSVALAARLLLGVERGLQSLRQRFRLALAPEVREV